jgi:hypothetical protein
MKPKQVRTELEANGFEISHIIGSGNYAIHSLYIDEKNRKWCYNNLKDKVVKIHSFDELLDVQTKEEYNSKTKGGGAGALAGGLLFGVTGAIVGSAMSTKKTQQTLKSRCIVVTVIGFSDNIIKIDAGSDTTALYGAFQSILATKQGGIK